MSVPYQPFPVVNNRTAVDLSLDPWLTPPDAFQQMLDAYQLYGVIYKRDGYSWFDQFPAAIDGGTDHNYYNVSNITTTINAQVTTYAAHGLTDGKLIRLTGVNGITTNEAGAPINGTRWTVTVIDDTNFTINNTGEFGGSYSSSPNDATLSIFPGNPIMAIAVWVDSGNAQNIVVLDTTRAAIFDTNYQCLVPIGYADQFTGSNKQLFWWENYFGHIFFTNNIDNIFYYDGSQLATGLTAFAPYYNDSDQITTCLMIKALNGRLCLYNTVEAGTRQPVNIRWCRALVDPTLYDPMGTPPIIPWYDQVPGNGGVDILLGSLYLISQGQIQTNNLLYSQSQQFTVLYEQRPTSDPAHPFVYNKIAVSRNVNSTFGTVVLDREMQAVGNSGLILSDGNSVGRYDDKIPEFAIDIISQDGFQSALGVRYDANWQSWLLYTSNDSPDGLNDQILVFNYQDRSWQFYRISLSCAGVVQDPNVDPAWITYDDMFTWKDFADTTWNSILQVQSPILLGGSYDGNLWVMNEGGGDAADNVAYGDIVPDGYVYNGFPIEMNLITRQWFPFGSEATAAQFGYIDFLIDGDPETLVNVSFNVDNETSNYLNTFFTCVPFEDIEFSTINTIENSNPAKVTSPDHGLLTGQNIYIFAVQGMDEVNNTFFTITVLNDDQFTLDGVDATSFGAYTGGGVITKQAITQTTFWTRVMCGQTGVFHQMQIVAQGVDENFALHASIPYFKKTGRIFKG